MKTAFLEGCFFFVLYELYSILKIALKFLEKVAKIK